MKTMKRLLLGTLVVVGMLIFIQPAFAYTIDGDLSEWGFTYGAGGFNQVESVGAGVSGISAGIYWREEDAVNGNGYVGPGYGGQQFDVEGLYGTIIGNDLYFAVVTGMKGTIGSSTYQPGDIIITAGSNQYAVETTGYRFNLNSSGYVTSTTGTGNAGQLYSVGGGTTLQNGLTNWSSGPYNQDPVQIGAAGAPISSISFVYAQPSGDLHAYMEGMIDLSLLDLNPTGGTIQFHFAQSCGNDGGSVTLPYASVPEPATMLLLGIGLIGLAGIGRNIRRRIKK